MPDGLDGLFAAYRLHLVIEQGHQHRTWMVQRRTVLAFLAAAGEPYDQVTTAHLERYTRRPGLSDHTRHAYTSHLKTFYAWLADAGHLPDDPFRKVKTPRVRPAPPRDLDLADVARLLDYAVQRPRLWVMAWLGYGAGLRCAEIASLRVEDVRLGGREPQLRVHGKGGAWRTVPLHPVLAGVLALWLDQSGLGASGPLLPSERDPSLHVGAHWVSDLLCGALRDAGVRATAHQLRHTFASDLLAECEDLRAVQQLLGHVSIRTTEGYTSGVTAKTRRAVGHLRDPRRYRQASGGVSLLSLLAPWLT